MNSSYNVSASTLQVIRDQFENANQVCEAVEMRQAKWSALFDTFPFFEAYNNYLQTCVHGRVGWYCSKLPFGKLQH
ncbi:hypothetical protein GOP47_0024429 [Adiantum capillus-veneris]|uniref:polynucleotide adenylyltransferase n=1 Tax=Adiantum capillus-veneris TaxID=13818 RepID=A0A9D4Z3P1_ADICA|nr:hypothetical protein GOP47_0024429 [Adiantum capillus-veneris]